MPAYPFLSPPWIAAAREIQEEYKDQVEQPAETLKLNVTVFDAPFSDNEVLGNVDTTSGSFVPNEGHLEDPDVSVQMPYSLCRQLLLDQQPETVMMAFMSGEIEVQGDITMIMSLQDVQATPEQEALAQEVVDKLTAITE